jgi:hypothetical protein
MTGLPLGVRNVSWTIFIFCLFRFFRRRFLRDCGKVRNRLFHLWWKYIRRCCWEGVLVLWGCWILTTEVFRIRCRFCSCWRISYWISLWSSHRWILKGDSCSFSWNRCTRRLSIIEDFSRFRRLEKCLDRLRITDLVIDFFVNFEGLGRAVSCDFDGGDSVGCKSDAISSWIISNIPNWGISLMYSNLNLMRGTFLLSDS